MLDCARLHVPLRRALGHAEYLALSFVGRLSDRCEFVYRMDAAVSTLRRIRNLTQREAAERADSSTLRRSERSSFSQNGEDGVIEEIFARIGSTTRHAIEIGAADGEENCTRNLVESGWTAHWIEADTEQATKAAKAGGPRVRVIGEFAYRNTVVRQLRDAGAAPEPDLLVVDIDGDDLGILTSCTEAFRPRVVVVEYNAAFSCAAIWAIKPSAAKGWDGTFRHGASLGALDHAASRSGYQLVYCDAAGVNAFFVRADLVGDHFTGAGRLPAHFRVSSFSPHPFGHPRSRRATAPMTPLTVDDVHSVIVKNLRVTPTRRRDILSVVVDVENGSDRWLTSPQQSYAFNLALRWVTRGTDLPLDVARIPVPRPIAPRSTCRVRLVVSAPPDSDVATLRVTVVGEGVAWREHLGGPGAFQDAQLSPFRGLGCPVDPAGDPDLSGGRSGRPTPRSRVSEMTRSDPDSSGSGVSETDVDDLARTPPGQPMRRIRIIPAMASGPAAALRRWLVRTGEPFGVDVKRGYFAHSRPHS